MENQFENLDQLSQMTQNLDVAELRQVRVGLSDTDEYVGIWNKSKDILETVVQRKDSTLIQHKDAFEIFIKAVRNKNLKISGTLHNHGGQVIVMAKFDELRIDDGSSGGVTAGARIENTYSNSRGPKFSGQAAGERNICMNGMIFGETLAAVFKKHEKQSDLDKAMMEFIGDITSNSKKIKEIIDEARNDKFENTEDAHEVILGEIGSKKKAKKIIELIEEQRDVTRYSVYNSMTQYATHHAQNEKERMRLQRLAEKVLTVPKEELKREAWDSN